MIKVRNGGITIEIPESEIDFYKRAGYSVVGKDVPVLPVEEVAPATSEEKNAEAVKAVNVSKAKK